MRKKKKIGKAKSKKAIRKMAHGKLHVVLPVFVILILAVVIAKTFASSNHLPKISLSPTPTGTEDTSAAPPSPTPTPSPQPIQASDSTIFMHGSRDKKQVALTFDADMTAEMKTQLEKGHVNSWYNKGVIDTLNMNHTKATLFLTGMWTEIYSQEAKEFAENPLFELANHSYSHPGFNGKCYGLRQAKPSEKDDEIEKPQTIIKNATGVTPRFFRFPGGCYSKEDLALVHKHGLIPVQWDVVGGDAFNKHDQYISQNILSQTQNGSIIVLHLNGGPNAPETNAVLSYIITVLKRRGFEFVTLSELLEGQTPPVTN